MWLRNNGRAAAGVNSSARGNDAMRQRRGGKLRRRESESSEGMRIRGLKNYSVWVPLLTAIASLLSRFAISICCILRVHRYREHPATTNCWCLIVPPLENNQTPTKAFSNKGPTETWFVISNSLHRASSSPLFQLHCRLNPAIQEKICIFKGTLHFHTNSITKSQSHGSI